MKMAWSDARRIQHWAPEQRGVFSTGDLRTALAEPHPAAFTRRVKTLIKNDVLSRFVRGWYVVKDFDVQTLSQRIAPMSYISFGTVLAEHLLIGANPKRQITASKVGRPRSYSALGYRINHVSIEPAYFFGHKLRQGIRKADPEKALLDVLYYHLRGRRYVFDVYSDIHFQKLDSQKFRKYLQRYRNSKFVAFAESFLPELRSPK